MGLTHFDENGKAVMVDVTDKKETAREAVQKKILVNRDVFQAVKAGTVGKGDVLAVAATAGIAGAKRTSDLIPMCHILPLTNCKVDFRMNEKECAIFCTCTVKVTGKTGVEMEALTGVSAALLTIYDMCKALDKKMEITDIRLLKKTGGKSGDIWNDFDRCAGLVGENLSAENRSAGNAEAEDVENVCRKKEKRTRRWKAAVVTMSDKGFAGEREDKSGPLICEMIADQGYDVVRTELLPDEQKEIEKCLCTLCDDERLISYLRQEVQGFLCVIVLLSYNGSCTSECSGDRRGDESSFGGSDAEGNVEQSCFRDPKSYVDRESSGQSESGKRKSGSSSSGSGTWT